MATRAEIDFGNGVWLLDLLVLGRPFYLATQRVDVPTAKGDTRSYQPGLADFALSKIDSGFSGTFGLAINGGVDWAELVARGVQIERARAVVRRWYPGLALERAEVFLAGFVQDIEYGTPAEGLRLSVGALPNEISTTVPPASFRVDVNTWPVRGGFTTDEKIIGANYPLVIGAPGHRPTGAAPFPVVPALGVEVTAADGNSRLLVSAGSVAAATVRLHDLTDTPADSDATVVEASDALGRAASQIQFSSTTITAAKDRKWYTGWYLDGGGLERRDGGGAVRGAMDVVRTVLERYSNVPLDTGRIAAEAARLDNYKIDTYINRPINAWDWVTREIIPLLPVVTLESERGVYWRFLDWNATAEDAIAHFNADTNAVARVSSIRTGDTRIVNEITMEYAPVATSERYRKRRTLTANYGGFSGDIDATQDTRVLGSYRCRQSQLYFGVRSQTFSTSAIWDDATAVLILKDIAAASAFPHRSVTYVGGSELAGYQIGDIITLTDSEVYLTNVLAMVSDVSIGGSAEVQVALTLLDNPAFLSKRTAQAKRTIPEPTEVTPATIPDLRSWWDGFDSATYDGSNLLTGITDKGPDARDLVPDGVGAGQTTATINGVPTAMPGPFSFAIPTEFVEATITEAINDYSVFFVVPLDGTGTTNDVYFTITMSVSPFYGLRIKNSTSGNGFFDVNNDVGIQAVFTAPKSAVYASGSSAIGVLRRSGGRFKVDVWYDVGAGIVKPAQIDVADTSTGAINASGFAFGGRGSLTQFWATNYLHTIAWYDRAMTDGEVVSVAQWAGNRLGFTGIV